MIEDLKIGLVVSGGMAVGAYHAGALKALSEVVPRSCIKVISTSSIGALNSYAYATGKIALLEACWKDVPTTGLWSMFRALRRDDIFFQYIDRVVTEGDVMDTRLFISTSDFKKPLVEYWCFEGQYQPRWRTLVYESASFPFLVPRLRSEKKRRFDGGLFDNIPVYPLFYEKGLDMVMILHSDPKFTPPEEIFSDGKLVFDYDVNLGMCKVIDHYKFDQKRLGSWFDNGYECAKTVFTDLFANTTTKEELRAKIIDFYKAHLEERKNNRRTADSVCSMCNNIFWNIFGKKEHENYE